MSDKAFALEISNFLNWMINKNPGEIEPIPFILTDAVRQNDKRPASIKMRVPDDWAKNILGDKLLLDTYLAIRVPGEYLAQWKGYRDRMIRENAIPSIPPTGESDAPASASVEGMAVVNAS